MRGTEFAHLAAFVEIAEHGSFSKAAAVLGIAPSTLSQTIRGLEERLGIRLFNRTTRSVALTEAGERLLTQVRPALEELHAAAEVINVYRDTPAGTLRLNVSSVAAAMIIAPLIGQFVAIYPGIILDVIVDDTQMDIVSGHFDAGIRPDAGIDQDMIAVRISPASRRIAIAAPDYLARHSMPQVPQDLRNHNCIRFRLTTGATYRWKFQKAGEKIIPPVSGTFITNDPDLVVRAALDGIGIAYIVEAFVQPLISAGRIVPVLEDWAPSFSGYHIFYANRRQVPAALRVFIDFLRLSAPVNGRVPEGSRIIPSLSDPAH